MKVQLSLSLFSSHLLSLLLLTPPPISRKKTNMVHFQGKQLCHFHFCLPFQWGPPIKKKNWLPHLEGLYPSGKQIRIYKCFSHSKSGGMIWKCYNLTLKKCQTKVAADDILSLYFYLLKKIMLDFSCESSAKQRIHIKYQALFYQKNNEKLFRIVVCSSRDWHFKG